MKQHNNKAPVKSKISTSPSNGCGSCSTQAPPHTAHALKGKPLNFNVGIQKWYVKELVKLVDDLTKEVYEEIKPLYKEYKEQITFTQDNTVIASPSGRGNPVQDGSITSQTRIRLNSLRELFEKKFKDRGKTFAERMVRKTNRYANTTFWAMMNEMLKMEEQTKQAGGFLLKGSAISPKKEEVMKALIYENTSLITNIQTRYFEQITGAVMRSIQSGLGVGHIEEELNKYRGMTKRRARNIALDQTRKAYNSINLRNMQDAGVKKFEWVHSGGSQKPRSYHMENAPAGLNHGIFELDNPPVIDKKTGERGYPGQLPYCHCRMAAVVEFDLSVGMDWKESEHPRDKDGKFTDGSGGGSSKQDKPKASSIAGVKQGKPMSLEKAIVGVNPNYDKNEGYRNNCQSCIAVFEARLRGYNIEALPFDKQTMEALEDMPNLAYINKKTGQPPKIEFLGIDNAGDCYRWLDKHIKKGERYAFGYAPTMKSAHIIIVTKTSKDNLVFYDPQKSLNKNPKFLNNMAYRSWNINGRIEKLPIVFRIDNAELNEEWMNKISKPSN